MTNIYNYVEQIKDYYGNLLNSFGVYEQTIKFTEGKPKIEVKLINTFDSLQKANIFLENMR
jgi:hypothetical protein